MSPDLGIVGRCLNRLKSLRMGQSLLPRNCVTIRAMKAQRHPEVRQFVWLALACGPAACRGMTARSSGAMESGTVVVACSA